MTQPDCSVRDAAPLAESAAVDWAQVELPPTWPDHSGAGTLFASALRRRRGKVTLPDVLPHAGPIPRYVLQEFHNLPNGNYSHRITTGYSHGFDHAMLGMLRHERRRMAQLLDGAQCALDLGCGAGHLALEMHRAGIPEVWGLEPSPYLLRLAARQAPQLRWVQGVGENSGLPDARFDGVGICFVLHEIPPTYIRRLLTELRRITRPGARLVVVEPSPLQWNGGRLELLRRFGWHGLYFRWMARRVFEPFADAWHRFDFAAALAAEGFEVQRDDIGCPFRVFVAERHL